MRRRRKHRHVIRISCTNFFFFSRFILDNLVFFLPVLSRRIDILMGEESGNLKGFPGVFLFFLEYLFLRCSLGLCYHYVRTFSFVIALISFILCGLFPFSLHFATVYRSLSSLLSPSPPYERILPV